jgi:hypothetical protein
VGRLVVEFLPDPIAVICRLCGLLRPGGIVALQESSWKIWLNYTSHLPLRMAVTTLLRDTFKAGGANTEMELPLFHGFIAANLTSPQLRLELPIGDSPEFRSLLMGRAYYVLVCLSCIDARTSAINNAADHRTVISRAAPRVWSECAARSSETSRPSASLIRLNGREWAYGDRDGLRTTAEPPPRHANISEQSDPGIGLTKMRSELSIRFERTPIVFAPSVERRKQVIGLAPGERSSPRTRIALRS